MDATTKPPSISEILRSYPFRVGVYSVVTFLVFESINVAIRMQGAARMGAENGPIEMTQLALAVISAVGLFCAAYWTPVGRAGLVVCGAMVTYAAARESDLMLETALFDDAYKWVVGLPMAILVVVVVIADRRRLIGGMMWLMRHPSATLFAVGGVFLCSVCQVLDRPDMWAGISNGHEAETTKALIEEYAELFAYLLLSFSGIEAAILAYSGRVSQRKTEGESEPEVAYSCVAAQEAVDTCMSRPPVSQSQSGMRRALPANLRRPVRSDPIRLAPAAWQGVRFVSPATVLEARTRRRKVVRPRHRR